MKIKAGIAGGAGYTGGELLRILVNHPHVEITFVHSKSQEGKFLYEIHRDLLGDIELKFVNKLFYDIDVLFLCVGHGEASKFLKENDVPQKIKIIDLSQDHRLANENEKESARNWIYGLPEINRKQIQAADNIANPGCFATCIELALLPLAAHHLLRHDIHISATTGSTGAGQALNATSHFSWRQNNTSIYKPFTHQHLAEINKTLTQLQNNFDQEISFVPYRGSFTRGIIAGIYMTCELNDIELKKIYEEYYASHYFVHLSDQDIDLKHAVNTNKCVLHLLKNKDRLLITSVMDNLLKGASGQAVQNMNLLFSLEEHTGLKLKASAF